MLKLNDSKITQWYALFPDDKWRPVGPCEAASLLTGIDEKGIEQMNWIPWKLSLGKPNDRR